MSRRIQRLAVLFQRELSALIRTELRDPRIGAIVSITRIDISSDLENATVHTSVLGDADAKRDTIKALSSAAPFLKHRLLGRLRIKKVPNFSFELDETIEEAAHVLDLMKKVSGSDED
ncbi:MAG: 30S ribosome-binding factor RbfA [Dehalococcoidia bacterium]